MRNRILLSVITTLFFIGCGGSSDSNGNETSSALKTGYLIDSYVEGVDYYINGNYSGITDNRGSFNYTLTSVITFKIGSVEIGYVSSVASDNHVSVQDICNVRRDVADNQQVINIATFLQSLDEDDNPGNGIKISSEIKEKFKKNIKLKDLDYSEIKAIISNAGKNVRSKSSVISHLEETMESSGITPFKLDENTLPEFYESTVGLPPLPHYE